MRQGQQNRRGRGRNNNNNNNNNQNRKGQNPLTRSFESTGPDVKLRGTPAHIAEKYIALARDAQSSGDPVLAENYLQHAEHYNRIIMAFREQQMAQGGGDLQNGLGRPRPAGFAEPVSMSDDFGDEDGGDFGAEVQAQPFAQQQPRVNDGPRYDDRDRGSRHEGGGRQFHRDRHSGDRDRGERGGYDRQERGERDRDRGERYPRDQRADRPERIERVERADRAPQPDINVDAPQQARRERTGAVPHHEQPEFLRRPVRRARREAANGEDAGAPAPTPVVEGSGE
jgi:hypothetical protein